MTLKEDLIADLEKHYFYKGIENRTATVFGILKNFFSPRFMPVVLFRISYEFYSKKITVFGKIISLINYLLFGIEISHRCKIGGGLYLPHTIGTVIGARSIGRNAVIFQGVTVGAKAVDTTYDEEARPLIGDNVTLGSGSKILGGIVIGNNVTVGANSVVIKSLGSNLVVGGIPSKVIRHTVSNLPTEESTQ
jgi:serine O-acetyltransferase